MKHKLTALIHEFDDEWDEALPATLLAMRTSVNRTTDFTPFFLEHGREAQLPFDMIAGPPPGQSTTLDCYTERLKVQFAKAFAVVTERQNSYVLCQKELYRERHHKINIDDLDWLYTDRPNPNLNRKFQSFWSGPYRVTRNLANTLFEIESYGRWTIEKIVMTATVDRLKKCFVNDPDSNFNGIPVELTAADVRPYFEHQELVGRLLASDFATHIFAENQKLPFSLPSDPLKKDNLKRIDSKKVENRFQLKLRSLLQHLRHLSKPLRLLNQNHMHCSLLLNCPLPRKRQSQQNQYQSRLLPKGEVDLLVAKTNPAFVPTALHLLSA